MTLFDTFEASGILMALNKQSSEFKSYKSEFEQINESSRDKIVDFFTRAHWHYDVDETRIKDRKVTRLVSIPNPKIFVFENLLSEEECDHLLALSIDSLEISGTVDYETGEDVTSSVRTSQSTYFDHGHDAVITAIEERISQLLDYPAERAESIHIARYGVGQEYKAHHDYFDASEPGTAIHLEGWGQRFATVLMYLNDVEEGGSTAFPELGLDFMPKKGNAVVFFYSDAFGNVDDRCLHAGTPVIAGEKWIATKWLRLWNTY